MESVANVLDYVNLGLLTLVALTAVWLWRRGRGRAALWAAITFGTLAFVVDFSRFLPEDPETTVEQVGQRALLVALFSSSSRTSSTASPSRSSRRRAASASRPPC